MMTAIKQPTPVPGDLERRDAERERVFDAFRRWGYLQASLDPIGLHLPPLPFPDLDDLSGPYPEDARRIYSGTIGAEFMHIPDREQRRWIAARMEEASGAPTVDRMRILDLLLRAELFEQAIQSRYLGTKRFSLEGVTALIPFLDQMMQNAIGRGAEQAVLAMSHRGRLNVMVHIVGTPPADIFARFEDVDPRSVLGGGDVKYHIGATGDYTAPDGGKMHIHLVSNPSHLEAVDPVAVGRTRAKQIRRGERGCDQVFAIVIHGDAAFVGQGIWAETLNYAEIPGYSVGGSVHVIANNLIGFTTEPVEDHSTRFASDLARRNNIPIFHVNGEDPDAVVRLAQIALEYRYTFRRDVVVDILGYRRHGHSEEFRQVIDMRARIGEGAGCGKPPLEGNDSAHRLQPLRRLEDLPADEVAETDFEDVEVERRVEVVAERPLALEAVDPGDDAALVIDVVVERHRHPGLVGAEADLVAAVEIEQRLVEHRIVGARLGRGRERAGGGVAIRHVDAETEVLLDLREEPRKARMRRRCDRGDHAEGAAVGRAHLFAAGGQTKIDHLGDRAARRARLIG